MTILRNIYQNLHMCVYFIVISLLVHICINICYVNCVSVRVPDQRVVVNKLFYYRLPLSSDDFKGIKFININDADNNQPEWLIFERTHASIELIGLPQHEHKGSHFIHLKILKSDDSREDDVFVLDVVDDTTRSLNHECIIKIVPSFASIHQVWRVISHLIPASIRRKEVLEDLESSKGIEFYNNIIEQWSHSTFTIKSDNTAVGYQVTIDKPKCDVTNEVETKLRELSIEYNLIRITRMSTLKDSFDDDEFFNKVIGTENIHQKNFYLKDEQRRMHVKRHYDRQNTPIPEPSWAVLSYSTDEHTRPHTDIYNVGFRVMPSISSPTKPMPTHRQVIPSSMFAGFPVHFSRFQTPLLTSEPLFESLATPTPALPTYEYEILSQTAAPSRSYDHSLISPSPTTTFSGPSEIDSPNEIRTNSAPELKQRIPKLEIDSGKYWKMKIPVNTFYDREDGNTEKLKLGFYMKNRLHLDKDYWIQFYPENQYLAAFPPDDQTGTHSFLLEAVDSEGLSVMEEVELRVNQHKASRTFHFNITFYQIMLRKYETIVDALKDLAFKVSKLYGDSNFDHFTIHSYRKEMIGDKEYWTISWTNDSLPVYPCQRQLIHDLYSKLIDKSSNKSSVPSQALRGVANFEIGKVILNVNNICSKKSVASASERPVVRNPIDVLIFELGQVFSFTIPSDTFYAPGGGGTYDLILKMYTLTGRLLDEYGFVKFDENSYKIIGLAVEAKYLGDNEFRLVAQTRETGADVSKSLIIKISNPENENRHSFEVTFGFTPDYGDFDLDMRLDVARKLTKEFFDDGSEIALRVLRINKFEYIIDDKESGASTEASEDITEVRRRRREAGVGPYLYEFVWTNSSSSMLIHSGVCPAQAIQDNILVKLFNPDFFETTDKVFGLTYRLVYVGFKAMENCSQYLQNKKYYKDGQKLVPISSVPPHGSTDPPTISHGKNDYGNELIETQVIDYYFKTIVPALLTILIMLLISCIIMCILCKYRKQQEKAYEQGSMPRYRSYLSNNRGVFKGQRAIIFDGDLTPQHLLPQTPNMVMMPSNTQHVPLRTFNKNVSAGYQPLSQDHRRMPPPYRSK